MAVGKGKGGQAGKGVGKRGAAGKGVGKRSAWNRQKAYDLWVVVQASMEETCEAAQITPPTLRRWRADFGWDDARGKFGGGLGSLLASFREQLEGIAADLRTAARERNWKEVAELNKAAGQLLQNAQRIQAIEQGVHYRRLALRWAHDFSSFLGGRRPSLLEQLLPELKAFIGTIARG